jgi:hypothetical protein
MNPTIVCSDLIYVERYHRDHGAPMTADIMARARALIYKQSIALGTLKSEKDQVMVVLVSDIDKMTAELKYLREVLELIPHYSKINES